MIVAASVPGTCGELFQGSLDGEPCLVSCPIGVSSTARAGRAGSTSPLPPKSRRAVAALGIPAGSLPTLALTRRLPMGRGYGTSTADLGAVLHAAAGIAGRPLGDLEATRIAISVEPSDSTLLPGLALLDHRAGRFGHTLGDAVEAAILVLDPGGRVDTASFNAHDWRPVLSRLAPLHADAFARLEAGIRGSDLAMIGAAATMSAVAHEAVLANPLLDRALDLAKAVGAVGVCRAHSGTVIGLLLAPSDVDVELAMDSVRDRLPASVRVWRTDLVGGGPRVVAPATVGVGLAS